MPDPEFLVEHRRLIAIDAETTGYPVMTAEQIRRAPKGLRPPGVIIDIGCVELVRDKESWRKGETWQTRVNPEAPISPASSRVHGIKPAELKQAPRFVDIVDRTHGGTKPSGRNWPHRPTSRDF